jgi:hypothetical protein
MGILKSTSFSQQTTATPKIAFNSTSTISPSVQTLITLNQTNTAAALNTTVP